MIEQQIIDWLIDSHSLNRFDEDNMLPSENILAQRFNVPRATVRRALTRLEEMGKVVAYQGKGRFFTGGPTTIALDLSGDQSFSAKVRREGHRLNNVLIDSGWQSPDTHVRSRLELNADQRVFVLSRLRVIDGSYLAIHTSYLPESLFPNIEQECRGIDSMYEYFRGKGYGGFESGETFLSVHLPDSQEQDALQLPPLVPVLVIDSDSRCTQSNILLQLTRIIYRGDGFRYQV